MDPRFVVLVAAILLAIVSASDSLIAKTDIHSISAGPNGVPPRRLLRAYITTAEDDEERALPGFDKLAGVAKSGVNAVKLKSWLGKNKPVADVFAKLKLSEKVEDALASSNLNILDKYVNMFKKKFPESKVSLLGTLTARYGDDVVAKALVSAKRVESSKEIAKKLQTQQLEGWLNNKLTADQVFGILKIREDGFASVISRKLETLEEYIKLFNANAKNPQDKTNLFRTLRNGFGGDAGFALVVERAMLVPTTAVKASTYENALFKRWLQSDLDPMSVFVKVFKLDENNLAAAGFRQKSIVEKYKRFYYRETGVLDQLPSVLHPRR